MDDVFLVMKGPDAPKGFNEAQGDALYEIFHKYVKKYGKNVNT